MTTQESSKKKMPLIEDWAVITRGDPYSAPELRYAAVVGKVYGHPDFKFEDGDPIKTSRIKEFNGKELWVKTENTRYDLGNPNKMFVEYLKDKGKKVSDYEI